MHAVSLKTRREDPTWETRHRWENNIKIWNIKKECKDVVWIHLAPDRRALVNTVMNLQVP
jgi:hypothetical protein